MEITLQLRLPGLSSYAVIHLNREKVEYGIENIEINSSICLHLTSSEVEQEEDIMEFANSLIIIIFESLNCVDDFSIIEEDEAKEPVFSRLMSMEDLRSLHAFIHDLRVGPPHQPQQ